MYKRILIPVDDDQPSRWAVEAGAKLAAKFHSAVGLIHVCVPPFGVGNEAAVMRRDVTETQRERSEELLNEMRGLLPGSMRVEHQTLEGQPADRIVEYARVWDADLVVISSHQRRGLARFVLGNVAEVVIRYAPCPVFMMRPKEKEEAPP